MRVTSDIAVAVPRLPFRALFLLRGKRGACGVDMQRDEGRGGLVDARVMLAVWDVLRFD